MSEIPASFLELTSGRRPPSIEADRLKLMGKQAARVLADEGIPLNDTIVKLASDVPGIGSEHIRRVVEFANQFSFHEQFEKKAGDEDRCVDFPVANATEVLQALRIPSQQPGPSLDYKTPPRSSAGDLADVFGAKTAAMVKQASIPRRIAVAGAAAGVPVIGAALAAVHIRAKHEAARLQDPKQVAHTLRGASRDLSAAASAIKTASEYPEYNPHGRTWETLERLDGIHQHLESSLSSLNVQLGSAAADAFERVKVATLNSSFEDAVAVMYQAVGKDKEKVAMITAAMVPRLLELGVPVSEDMSKLGTSMKRVVSRDSDLFQSLSWMDKVATACDDTASMLAQVTEARRELNTFIEANNMLTAGL